MLLHLPHQLLSFHILTDFVKPLCYTQGRNGAVCVIALAERGALFDPGPCMYMEKLAVGPAVDPRAVDLNKSIKENLEVVAKALNKPIGYVDREAFATTSSVLLLLLLMSWPCRLLTTKAYSHHTS